MFSSHDLGDFIPLSPVIENDIRDVCSIADFIDSRLSNFDFFMLDFLILDSLILDIRFRENSVKIL